MGMEDPDQVHAGPARFAVGVQQILGAQFISLRLSAVKRILQRNRDV